MSLARSWIVEGYPRFSPATSAVAYKVLTLPVAFRYIPYIGKDLLDWRTYLTHKNKMFDIRFEYGVNVNVRIFNINPPRTLQWNSNGIMGSSNLVQFYGALGKENPTFAFYRFKVANDARGEIRRVENAKVADDKHSTEILRAICI